jgi:hypothetical protein
VKTLPATVNVPLREPMVGATLNLIVPAPTPLVAEVIVIQGGSLRAVHGHCESAVVNVTLPAPPEAGKD